MTDSHLSIKRERVLFGRGQTLSSLVERVIEPKKYRLLLIGPSGIGKSELLRELDASLRLVHYQVCLRSEIRSAAHSVQDMLSNLAVQLLSQADIEHRQGFTDALTSISAQDSWSLGTAALLDAVSIVAPNLKNTTQALLTSIRQKTSRGTAEHIAQAGRDDLLAGFIRLIQALDETGLRGSVLIDGLEGGSQAVQEAALALALSLPATWATIFAVNDETSEGLKCLELVRPKMTYIGGEEFSLEPLTIGALESWTKAVQGETRNIDELTVVLENCGGRPLFLKDWVTRLITTEATGLILQNRLGNYYEQRISALSADARWLLVRLAILPEHSVFSFQFCHRLLEHKSSDHSQDSTWELLRELKAKNFVESIDPDFRIVHAVTRNHVFKTLPEPLLRSAAADLLQVIVEVHLQPQQADDSYIRLVLSDLAGDREAVVSLTIPTASELLSAGSYRPALTAYSIGLNAANSVNNLELSVEALIGMAVVLLNTGYYQSALDRLSEIQTEDIPDRMLAKMFITRGEILMRLNRYQESISELERAHKIYGNLDDLGGQLAAEKIRNVILRDLGRYDEAVILARSIVNRAKDAVEPSPLLASCFQALARSLAFRSDISSGVQAAERALEISVAIQSIRNEGNSYLALAEVYRHHLELDRAISNYEEAIRIAEATANRDSFLWSSLGLADSLLLKGDKESAVQALDQVREIVQNASAHYPLEYLHWQLSVTTIDYVNHKATAEELIQAARNYENLGISWPENYVESVISNGKATIPKDM